MPPASSDNRRLAAVLFISVVGSNARVQSSKAQTTDLVNVLWQVVRDLIGKHHGKEVDRSDDGMLIEFSGALAASHCPLELHRQLASRNREVEASQQLLVRCSIQLGELEHSGAKVYGEGIHIAAQLLPSAPAGSVVVSVLVWEQLSNVLRHPATSLGKSTGQSDESLCACRARVPRRRLGDRNW